MKRKSLLTALAFMLVFGLLFVGCPDKGLKEEEEATVTKVTVSPPSANVDKGKTRHFTVHVEGTNNPADTVEWSVTGNASAGTAISSTGILTVASNETATNLTVTATSTVDPTQSGDAAVRTTGVTAPTDNRILVPAQQNTALSGGSLTISGANHGGGSKWLIPVATSGSRAYGYETWDEETSPGVFNGTATFTWYGRNQGGGLAFKAEWTNVKDFLARTGYNWNENKSPADYGNIYCGFNFTRTDRYNGNFSYIGIYGWSRNPGASVAAERLIEYYIVEDSYGNQYRDANSYQLNIGNETLGIKPNDPTTGKEEASYDLDGATYKVFRKTRRGPSIAGNNTDFTQFFSVRQTPRKSGTVSITKHFDEWDSRGMFLGTNIYECKWKVEAGGNESASGPGTGTFDARFIQFYRADDDGNIIEITPH